MIAEEQEYHLKLIKYFEIETVERDEKQQKILRFFGIDLKIYEQPQHKFHEPLTSEWIIIAFLNPHQQNFNDYLEQLDLI